MANATLTVEEILALPDWELAFNSVGENDELYPAQRALEEEFEIDFSDIETARELAEDKFGDFTGKLSLTLRDFMQQRRDELYRQICIEFEYCKKRNTKSAKALEASILLIDIFQTGGIAYLILFGFRSGFLDELCQCGSQ